MDTPAGLILGVLLAIILGGCVAAFFAYLIGLPVLRLKSDYLAIATLGFAEIIRAIFQWQALGPITNGANMITQIPTFNNFNITDSSGKVVFYLSSFFPMLIMIICVAIIVMLINSSYGRAFKAIREDEIAAEAMGINLAKHKRMAFCISSFFAGVGGGLFAMFANQAQAKTFTTSMTYEILLIVVIGRHRVHLRQLHRLVPVRGGQRVVAAIPGHRDSISAPSRCPSCGPASGWWCSPSSS